MAGLQPISALPVRSAEPAPGPDRLARAAHEFEALLLTSLLSPLEKSFSAIPGAGEDAQAGADNYGYMGVQALASALSKSGGLGIADLMVHQLQRTEVGGSASEGSSQAVSRYQAVPE